jgi:hypothetical protein
VVDSAPTVGTVGEPLPPPQADTANASTTEAAGHTFDERINSSSATDLAVTRRQEATYTPLQLSGAYWVFDTSTICAIS